MPSIATHTIEIAEGSELSKIFGTKTEINSYHHQAVKELAPNFKAVAWSSDGLIEAFESNEEGQYVLALQGHPETMVNDYEGMQELFNHFVQYVREKRLF